MVPSHGSSNSGCARAKSRRRMTSASCSSLSLSDSSPSNSRRFSSNQTTNRWRSSGFNPRIASSNCSKLTAIKSNVGDSSIQRFNASTDYVATASLTRTADQARGKGGSVKWACAHRGRSCGEGQIQTDGTGGNSHHSSCLTLTFFV
jgi:hypothetical protein